MEQGGGDVKRDKFVLSLDVGTTNVRAHIYNSSGERKAVFSKHQQILHPSPGRSELDPQQLIKDICEVCNKCIKEAGLSPTHITSIGITCLRNTFITWDKETKKPFHNLITWQDMRAADYVANWNKSITLRGLNTGAKLLHTLFRQKRHLAASVLKFMSSQVTMRLLWVLDKHPQIRQLASQGRAMFGGTETWILWNLTGSTTHATDYSFASATGMFDPFQMEWSSIVCNLLNIPLSILPKVLDTSGYFGHTDPSVIGFQCPINAVVADQHGAMFGHCCFDVGDVKCTMGTGTFLDMNTGSKPHASVAGLYPLVGWKIGKEVTFLAEGCCSDTGTALEWIQSIGLIDNLKESSQVAETVPDSGGVYFVNSFSGLQAPFNDDKAVPAFIGMTLETGKAHLVRSVLEAIAFRFKALYETALKETCIPLSTVRVDGGVSTNDFLVQMMSDLVDQSIERNQHGDMTSLGAAYLAGLAAGVWRSKEELRTLRRCDKKFSPRSNWPELKRHYKLWENAVERTQQWYSSN